MTPSEFWALSPRDFKAVVKGAQKRIERQRFQDAWIVSHLLNVSGKTVKGQVTIAQLLGKVVARKGGSDEGADES